MKVLHLIGGGDVGGAKIHVLSLVKELSKHIDVKIVSFRSGMFSDEAQDMGINIEVVKTGNVVSDIKRVIQIINEEKYELIHSHGSKGNMMAVIVKALTKLPIVSTVHSDYKLDYLQSIYKRFTFGLINAAALRFIDYYVAVSNSFKKMLIGRNFNGDKIFTVYNGIDFDTPVPDYPRSAFCKKYKIDLNEDDIAIGILVRLHPVKGLDTFLKAAKDVLKKHPSVKFLIGGDGEQRKSLERMASTLGIANNVLFLGYVDNPYEFMSCIDINVLTSISESFPYSILEGTRLKKATISSDVGGIADLIDNSENSYLFNPGDYRKLVEHILNLIEDSSLRNEMGERLFEKARAKFSLTNMCRTQLDIYESILSAESCKTRCKNKKSKYDVIVSGYYGSGNVGDDAILMAIVDNLRSYNKDIKILVLSMNPAETRTNYRVDSVNRFNLFKIILAMKNAKLFINGGGSLIQDITSTRSLMYYLANIWLAKQMGLKVMVYANGIGPVNRKINRKLTKRIVNQVDIVTLRESISGEELNNLFIDKPKTFITADPALTIEASKVDEVDRIFEGEGIDPNGPFIGFSVRKWGNHEEYEYTIAKVADYMVDKYGIKPVFIPMHYPSDLSIAKSIVSKMKGKGYIIKKKYSVEQMLGITSKMDMLIGMRLHALIFAASLGVPVVGLVYEPKVEGFLKSIQQASAGHVEQLDYNSLKDLADETWNKRADIKKHLEVAIIELKEKALENAKIAIKLMED